MEKPFPKAQQSSENSNCHFILFLVLSRR